MGAGAGIVATGAMSLLMAGFAKAGALGEPPPRKLTRRVFRRLEMPFHSRNAENVASLLAHFGYGALLGALFGLLPRTAQSRRSGAAYGLAIWASNYAGVIPWANLMPPPSRDRPGRPTAMIAAHLVYGAVLGGLFAKARAKELVRDRVVVVCGGSRGLGLAMAREAAARGAKVAICARNVNELRQAEDQLRKYSGSLA